MDQAEKFARFQHLHDCKGAFVIPNPWDAGSARLLASLGFQALATTSAGYAFSKGKRDSFSALDRGRDPCQCGGNRRGHGSAGLGRS
jgi:2-methylisocitrate lyase-like PEP mutase family enzyme